MGTRPLTARQQYWLDHLTAAAAREGTLVDSALCRIRHRANKIEPYRYLRKIFTELPKANCLDDIEALLPDKIG